MERRDRENNAGSAWQIVFFKECVIKHVLFTEATRRGGGAAFHNFIKQNSSCAATANAYDYYDVAKQKLFFYGEANVQKNTLYELIKDYPLFDRLFLLEGPIIFQSRDTSLYITAKAPGRKRTSFINWKKEADNIYSRKNKHLKWWVLISKSKIKQ